jgi:predicted PurR-regulated permease PerM
VNPNLTSNDIYRALAKAIYLAAGVFILLWLVDTVLSILLIAFFGLVLWAIFNPMVTGLERRRVPRPLGTLLVLGGVLGSFAFMGYISAPVAARESRQLVKVIPQYVDRVQERLQEWATDIPALSDYDEPDEISKQVVPFAQRMVSRVGRYSLSIVAAVALFVILLTGIAFALSNPRPLLSGYVRLFPEALQDRAANAFARGSRMVTGWAFSNAIVGAVEAVATGIFLTWMQIPGALVWAFFAFFAELIPILGSYLMAVPPLVIALAIDPQKALWVLLFYVAIQQLASTFLAPMTQSNRMRLHPMSIVLAVLLLGTAFGVIGAVIATPLLAYFKSFWEEFYLKEQPDGSAIDARVERMLAQDAPDPAERFKLM